MHTGLKSIHCPVGAIDLLKLAGRAKACAAALTLVLCAVLAIAGCSMASGSEYADAKPLIAQEQDGQTGQSVPESLPPAEQGASVTAQTAMQVAAPEAQPLSAQMPAEPSPVSDPPQPEEIPSTVISSAEKLPIEIPLAEIPPAEMPLAEMPSTEEPPDIEIPDETQEVQEEEDDGLLFIDIFDSPVPAPGVIPNVIGKTREEAEMLILESGFCVEINEIYSDTAPISIVVSYSSEGSMGNVLQELGRTVVLNVCIGKSLTVETSGESID